MICIGKGVNECEQSGQDATGFLKQDINMLRKMSED